MPLHIARSVKRDGPTRELDSYFMENDRGVDAQLNQYSMSFLFATIIIMHAVDTMHRGLAHLLCFVCDQDLAIQIVINMFHFGFWVLDSPGKGLQVSGHQLLGAGNEEHRARINSQYMRELTRGNFLIKCQRITLTDIIGQGTFKNNTVKPSSIIVIMSSTWFRYRGVWDSIQS